MLVSLKTFRDSTSNTAKAPHIGHLYSMILGDILKRWQLLKGREAILCTGTDEHGMKIQNAAKLAAMPPKEFCDQGAATFQSLAAKLNMSNDHFARTTDAEHKDAVQHFWHMLQEHGFIYQSKHEGWYCVSDETFYPANAVTEMKDHTTGRTFTGSIETGKEVEWTSETNYHFKLSQFKDQLLEFYAANPNFVQPPSRMRQIVQSVSQGLQDLSISRPRNRLSWGIPVPDDASQTIYVWLDALVSYITTAGYPWAPGTSSQKGWPADVHVVGKDILRFHCIYWPAFLMALGIQLPKQILTHAHWTVGGQKMAKSTGNVVDPFHGLDRLGVDGMRFCLTYQGNTLADSSYTNEHNLTIYRKHLSHGLGNLLLRLVKPEIWNVRDIVIAQQSEEICAPIDEVTAHHVEYLKKVAAEADQYVSEGNLNTALARIMEVIGKVSRELHSPLP